MYKVAFGLKSLMWKSLEPIAVSVVIDTSVDIARRFSKKTGRLCSVWDGEEMRCRGWSSNGSWCWALHCQDCNGIGRLPALYGGDEECKKCQGFGVLEDRNA